MRGDRSRRASGPTTATRVDRPKPAAADRKVAKAVAGPKGSKPSAEKTVQRAEKVRGRGSLTKPAPTAPARGRPPAPKVEPVKAKPAPAANAAPKPVKLVKPAKAKGG